MKRKTRFNKKLGVIMVTPLAVFIVYMIFFQETQAISENQQEYQILSFIDKDTRCYVKATLIESSTGGVKIYAQSEFKGGSSGTVPTLDVTTLRKETVFSHLDQFKVRCNDPDVPSGERHIAILPESTITFEVYATHPDGGEKKVGSKQLTLGKMIILANNQESLIQSFGVYPSQIDSVLPEKNVVYKSTLSFRISGELKLNDEKKTAYIRISPQEIATTAGVLINKIPEQPIQDPDSIRSGIIAVETLTIDCDGKSLRDPNVKLDTAKCRTIRLTGSVSNWSATEPLPTFEVLKDGVLYVRAAMSESSSSVTAGSTKTFTGRATLPTNSPEGEYIAQMVKSNRNPSTAAFRFQVDNNQVTQVTPTPTTTCPTGQTLISGVCRTSQPLQTKDIKFTIAYEHQFENYVPRGFDHGDQTSTPLETGRIENEPTIQLVPKDIVSPQELTGIGTKEVALVQIKLVPELLVGDQQLLFDLKRVTKTDMKADVTLKIGNASPIQVLKSGRPFNVVSEQLQDIQCEKVNNVNIICFSPYIKLGEVIISARDIEAQIPSQQPLDTKIMVDVTISGSIELIDDFGRMFTATLASAKYEHQFEYDDPDIDDGGGVIDTGCRTSDPSIPCCKTEEQLSFESSANTYFCEPKKSAEDICRERIAQGEDMRWDTETAKCIQNDITDDCTLGGECINSEENCKKEGENYTWENNQCTYKPPVTKTLQEQCLDLGEKYEWKNNQCEQRQSPTDEELCRQKGLNHLLENNICVYKLPDNFSNDAKQKLCEALADHVWENSKCVSQINSGGTEKEKCLAQGSDFEWTSTGCARKLVQTVKTSACNTISDSIVRTACLSGFIEAPQTLQGRELKAGETPHCRIENNKVIEVIGLVSEKTDTCGSLKEVLAGQPVIKPTDQNPSGNAGLVCDPNLTVEECARQFIAQQDQTALMFGVIILVILLVVVFALLRRNRTTG